MIHTRLKRALDCHCFTDPWLAKLDPPMAKKQRAARREHVKKSLAEKKYGSMVWMHHRKCRLAVFAEIAAAGYLTDKEYWELLGAIWSDSEYIFQNMELWQLLLSAERPQKKFFMSTEEREALHKLPEVLTIYRGYQPLAKNENGVSWTLRKDVAAKLGNRVWTNIPGMDKPLGDPQNRGKVTERRIKKSQVFAYLTGRNEDEIIILPNGKVSQ